MTTIRAEATAWLTATPDSVFALVTDIERLPEWNTHIHHVVQAPSRLAEGAEWVVEMRALGTRWDSRSTALAIDPAKRTFAHRTQTDDDNPSYALWTWRVRDHGTGAEVTVKWELHPKTFWRRRLLAAVRHRQLKKETRVSLAAADRILALDRADA